MYPEPFLGDSTIIYVVITSTPHNLELLFYLHYM